MDFNMKCVKVEQRLGRVIRALSAIYLILPA